MSTPKTVIFADILGFERLVEDSAMLPIIDPFAISYLGADRYFHERGQPALPGSLEHVFAHFHDCLNRVVVEAVSEISLQTVVFSDSAFIALDSQEQAFPLAIRLMRRFLQVEVPVRMGIGGGSFRLLRFSADGDPDSRVHLNSVQFLGKAVTQAVAAERCGIGGMRILLHPHLLVPQEWRSRRLPIPDTEHPPATRAPVIDELNYFVGSAPRSTNSTVGVTSTDVDSVLRDCVVTMMSRTDLSFRYHYQNTLDAMERMTADVEARRSREL